jgi:hypothetical protein
MPEEPKNTPKTPTYEDMLKALGEGKMEFLSDMVRLDPPKEREEE